jgi:hypothetical protein
MAATDELLMQATPPPASPGPPPLSSTPAPAPPPPAPVPTFLAPPPVRAPEVETDVEPLAEPLFTVKVWQLGFAVIVLLVAFLYIVGIL